MMKNTNLRHVALIYHSGRESFTLLTQILKTQKFDIIFAQTEHEATLMLDNYLPHVLFLDIDLNKEMRPLEWLTEVKAGPLAFIPAVVVSGTAKQENISPYLKLGVHDFILKTVTYPVLTKKVSKLRDSLNKIGLYQLNTHDLPERLASLSVEGAISGISETGICVESCIIAAELRNHIDYTTELFDRMGIKNPVLRFLNTKPMGAFEKGKAASKNYFQILGWSEPERKQLRIWVRENGLRMVKGIL